MAEARGSGSQVPLPGAGREATPLDRVSHRYALLGVLLSAALAVGGVYLFPESARIVLAASAGLATVALLFLFPLDALMPLFIFAICFSAWIPLSIDVAGLNIRASQILLPIVYYRWFAFRPAPRVSRDLMLVMISGGVIWCAVLFWTLVHSSTYESLFGPLGRVVLLALNLLHIPPIVFYATQPQRWNKAVLALLVSIAILNSILLVAAIAIQMGLRLPEGWVVMEQAPVLLGRQLTGDLVPRFTFAGVTGGVMSTVVLIIATTLLVSPGALRGFWWWVVALVGSIGMVVGFSRQAVISLAAGIAVFTLGLLRHTQPMRAVGAAALASAITLAGMGIVTVLPGGRPFQSAFTGRSAQLVQPQAYRTGTVEARMVLWRGMLRDVARNPMVGAGQDVYVKYMADPGARGAHNFPIEILHAGGLVGFLAYAVLHATLFMVAWRVWNSPLASDGQPWLALGVAGGYVAVWLSSLTNLIYTNPVYWAVVGLLLAAGGLPPSDSRPRVAGRMEGHPDRSAADALREGKVRRSG